MARSRDAAQACADALVAAGGQARGYAADVGDRTSMDAAARRGAGPWRHRHRLRQRRHLPQRVAGRDRRAGLGPGAEHQCARRALHRAGLSALAEAGRGRPRDPDLVDHRPRHRLSGLGALRGQQGGAAGFHAHRRAGTGAPRHHDQCGPARQRAHRGAERDGPGLPGTDDALGAAAASGQRARHRLGGAVPGLARGRLHHRADAGDRWRPDPAESVAAL